MIYNLNKFNNNINNIIDEYLKLVTTNELKYYLKNKNNFNEFINRYNITNEKYEDILLIIDDRDIYQKKNIKNENMNIVYEYSKILSDFYNVSVSHIVETKSNKFEIDDLGEKSIVYIYNKDDFAKYRETIIKKVLEDINNKSLITSMKFFKAIDSLEFDFKKHIDMESIKNYFETQLDEDKSIEWVSKILNSKFVEEYNDCYIFEK